MNTARSSSSLFISIATMQENRVYEVSWRLESANQQVLDRKAYRFKSASVSHSFKSGLYFDHFVREELALLKNTYTPAIVLSEESKLHLLNAVLMPEFSKGCQVKTLDKQALERFTACLRSKTPSGQPIEPSVNRADCLASAYLKKDEKSNIFGHTRVKEAVTEAINSFGSTPLFKKGKKHHQKAESKNSAEEEGCASTIIWFFKWAFYLYLIFVVLWLLGELFR